MSVSSVIYPWTFVARSAREKLDRMGNPAGVEVHHPYDPQFLGAQSNIRIDESAYQTQRQFRILRHEHYSAVYDTDLRMPLISFSNVDYSRRIETPISETRTFSFDPMLPVSEQAGEEYYKRSGFDRGHLTRRRPLAWGDTLEEAEHAQRQSDYYSNITLQYAYFNRVAWASVENSCFDKVAADRNLQRSIEISGVWFDPSKRPTFERSIDPKNVVAQRVADAFWKICVFAGQTSEVWCYFVPHVHTGPSVVDSSQYVISVAELKWRIGREFKFTLEIDSRTLY